MRKSLSSGRRRREATLQSHQAFLIRRKATRLRCASSLQFRTSSRPSSKPRPQAPSAATPAPPPTTANPLPAPVDVPVLDVSRPCSHTPRDLCVWFLLLNFLKIKKKSFSFTEKPNIVTGFLHCCPFLPLSASKVNVCHCPIEGSRDQLPTAQRSPHPIRVTAPTCPALCWDVQGRCPRTAGEPELASLFMQVGGPGGWPAWKGLPAAPAPGFSCGSWRDTCPGRAGPRKPPTQDPQRLGTGCARRGN